MVCFVLVAALFAIVVFAKPVAAPPPIPMRTEGFALDASGSPISSGTPIRALLDGVLYSDASQVEDASGTFRLVTHGNSVTNPNVSDTPNMQEGANLGDTIHYAAGDFTSFTPVFREVDTWLPGGVTQRNLTLGSSGSTPQPLKIHGVLTQPARGGAQSVLLCNPTASTVSLEAYILERNAPGVYRGPQLALAGSLAPDEKIRVVLASSSWLNPLGDALKLVYLNPGGVNAPAGGADIVVDRVEFNATQSGALTWEPANTIMGDAPAPGPGRMLVRDESCTDTNRPEDFVLVVEAGLPMSGPPSVTIQSPAPGETVEIGTTATFRWTISDNVFIADYLRVWANLTIGGETIELVSDQANVTSVEWAAPSMPRTGVSLRVEVVNPFDQAGADSRTFDVTTSLLIPILIAVLVVAVLAAFLLLAFLRSRKRPELPRPTPPPPSMPPPATAALAPPSAAQKTCPRCHTIVGLSAATCFFCGYTFPEETPPPP